MPECDYCGASFDSEAAELDHLAAEHRDELGPIDKRRVGDDGDDGGLPTGPIALGVVLLISIGIVGYVVFIAGGSGADAQPTADGTHEHGMLEVTIDGEEIDLTQPKYTSSQGFFHIHPGQEMQMWHTHGSPVTLKFALEQLGMEVNDDATVLTFENETYRESEGAEIRLEVDGESVGPDYTLDGVSEAEARQGGGDQIRVVVET